jgi:hypothetical protein
VEKTVTVLAPVHAIGSGDSLSKVADTDSNYLVMKKGDEFFLKFPYQPASGIDDLKRDFVFVSRGYYISDPK